VVTVRTTPRLATSSQRRFTTKRAGYIAKRGYMPSKITTPHLKALFLLVSAGYIIKWPRIVLQCRLRLKRDGTRAETSFRLSAKRTSPFKSARGEGGGCQFIRLLAVEVCSSAVVMLDTPRSEVVWSVLATHSIRQFPLNFPSSASPCAITFQLDSTDKCQQEENERMETWRLSIEWKSSSDRPPSYTFLSCHHVLVVKINSYTVG